jgi:hypothetical protein
LVDAAHATPGQLELARSVPVRQAVKAAGLGFRLLRSDQAQVAELGLLPLIEREGVPLFVMVDERGTVLRLLRAPMESDVLALLEGVAP